jgi:protein subunit release factor A
MKAPIQTKLDQIVARRDQLQSQLSDQHVTQDMDQFQKLSRELHHIQPIADAYERYCQVQDACHGSG